MICRVVQAAEGWSVTLSVEEFAAVMPDDDEREEQTESEGRHEEEIDGDDVSGMRGEKGAPRRRRPMRCPAHVLGDGQLGDPVAEQGEFNRESLGRRTERWRTVNW